MLVVAFRRTSGNPGSEDQAASRRGRDCARPRSQSRRSDDDDRTPPRIHAEIDDSAVELGVGQVKDYAPQLGTNAGRARHLPTAVNEQATHATADLQRLGASPLDWSIATGEGRDDRIAAGSLSLAATSNLATASSNSSSSRPSALTDPGCYAGPPPGPDRDDRCHPRTIDLRTPGIRC